MVEELRSAENSGKIHGKSALFLEKINRYRGRVEKISLTNFCNNYTMIVNKSGLVCIHTRSARAKHDSSGALKGQ